MKKIDDVRISKYMWRSESMCQCDRCSEAVVINPKLLSILDEVREFFGYPLVSHCMVRCIEHNQEEGGTENSRHLPKHADACDFHIQTVEHSLVYAYLTAQYGDEIGVHEYSWGIHLDTRGYRARW